MSLTYPLQFPGAPNARRITWRPRAAVAESESPFTLRRQLFVNQGQRWEADIELPPMTRAQAETWIAFLLSLNGKAGTFLFGPTFERTTQLAVSGTIAITGVDGTTITTGGWTGAFSVGDFIQVHTSLYKLITVDNDNFKFDVWPTPRSDVATEDEISYSYPKGVFRLPTNEMPWTVDEARHFGINLSAVEAL